MVPVAQNAVRDRVSDSGIRSRELIDDCLAGNEAAWTDLFHQLQPRLLKIVRILLGDRVQDQDLVDEINARVWYILIDREYHGLRQFDQESGHQLTTYLATIARTEWLQYLRGERRRAHRETLVATLRKNNSILLSSDKLIDDDFRIRLTQREREYWDFLIGDMNLIKMSELSSANVWKLRQRIRKKLLAYLGGSITSEESEHFPDVALSGNYLGQHK